MSNTGTIQLHTVAADFTYRFPSDQADESGFFDAVVDHLHELGMDDVFLAVDHGAKTLTLSVLVTSAATDVVEVINVGIGAMRAAFQACGGATPEWPTPHEAVAIVDVTTVNATMNEEPRDLVAV